MTHNFNNFVITAFYTIVMVFFILPYPFAISTGATSASALQIFSAMFTACFTKCLPISIILLVISLLLKKAGHSYSGIARIMFFINLAICLASLFSARSQLQNLFSQKVHIILFLSSLILTLFAGIIAQNAYSRPDPEIVEIYISELKELD